jgi:hypothetical protein
MRAAARRSARRPSACRLPTAAAREFVALRNANRPHFQTVGHYEEQQVDRHTLCDWQEARGVRYDTAALAGAASGLSLARVLYFNMPCGWGPGAYPTRIGSYRAIVDESQEFERKIRTVLRVSPLMANRDMLNPFMHGMLA